MSFHEFTRDGGGWRTLESTREYTSPHLTVDRAVVATPSRPDGALWTVAHRRAGAVVVPRLENGDLLLIRQERLPIKSLLWEFPAGQIDTELESATSAEQLEALALETARRELREETGYQLAPGAELLPLGHFFSSPGLMDELSFLFLAPSVIPDAEGVKYDDGEAILECRAFSPAALREMIACGEICDANSLACFARLTARGLL